MNIKKSDLKRAHRYSSSHKAKLEKDAVCGCFYCLAIYNPAEIKDWMIFNNPVDRGGTAICPYCGVDSVIGESSGFPITKEFLTAMRNYWF